MALKKSRLEYCIEDMNLWMLQNMLKLNGDKSELLVLSSSYRPRPPLDTFKIVDNTLTAASTATNIGVLFENSPLSIFVVFLRSVMFPLLPLCMPL